MRLSDDSKGAAAAADGPEEISVLVLVCRHNVTSGSNHYRPDDVVSAHSDLARQIAVVTSCGPADEANVCYSVSKVMLSESLQDRV